MKPTPGKTISEECARKLPEGSFLRFEEIFDMDNKLRDSVVWMFTDKEHHDVRMAHFDRVTGEYLGEAF